MALQGSRHALTRQVRAATDESRPSAAQRSAASFTCTGRRGRRPRPGPPRQLSARTAGPSPRPAVEPPASAALRPWPTGPRAPQQPRRATNPSLAAAPASRKPRAAGATGQPGCPGPPWKKAVAMETRRVPAAV